MNAPSSEPAFAPETLRARVAAATQHALASGALQPIATDSAAIHDAGIIFPVRILARIERKEAATRLQRAGDTRVNPFLPYERDLWVADLTPTHVCLLNKFNVIDAHLLLVTRTFQSQERLLTLEDFTALSLCLGGYAGLGFYNGGRDAGASQPHKHLQFVPLPLAPECAPLPIAPLLAGVRFDGEIGNAPRLPFRHALCRLSFDPDVSPIEMARHLFGRYQALMRAVGIGTLLADDGERHATPYNLLVTREWMMLVPRSVESYETISVNALGFAGAFLVRNQSQLEQLRRIGPLALLRAVGVPG